LKAGDYKFLFISGIMESLNNNNILFYVIIIPLFILGFILFVIFCVRRRRHHHLHSTDSLKSSMKPRQPLIQPNGVMIPSATCRTNNDYLGDSVDSIPVSRQQRYVPSAASDLVSVTSSNLYYARVPAL
jgi:hypothetical protein